jgi:hypothetical protein
VGRLEIKPHEPKNRDKTRVKMKGDKKPNRKRGEANKTLCHKKVKKANKKEKIDKKAIKEKELKIKVLSHELLAFTLFYLLVAPW